MKRLICSPRFRKLIIELFVASLLDEIASNLAWVLDPRSSNRSSTCSAITWTLCNAARCSVIRDSKSPWSRCTRVSTDEIVCLLEMYELLPDMETEY